MKHFIIPAIAFLIPLGLAFVSPASAGFFDKLKKTAEDSVSDFTNKAKESVSITPESEKTESASPSAPATKTAASGDKAEVTLPTSQIQMARGVFSAAPEIFESRPQVQLNDYAFKRIVELFFPEERDNIRNEFRWRKNKTQYQKKILMESRGAPTTFEVAPWLNNASSSDTSNQPNNLVFYFGRYDFDREAWPVSVTAFSLQIGRASCRERVCHRV